MYASIEFRLVGLLAHAALLQLLSAIALQDELRTMGMYALEGS
jgi:hypothetical protein